MSVRCRTLCRLLLASLLVVAIGAIWKAPLILAKSTWLLGDVGSIDDDVDILIVAGGDQCFTKASQWYAESPGSRQLAIIEAPPKRLARHGIEPENHDRAMARLARLGVPAASIVFIPRGDVPIDQDHRILIPWAAQRPNQRIGLLVSYLAVRRTREQLRSPRLERPIEVIGLANREYAAEQWFRDQQGIKAFSREALKWAFWRCVGSGTPGPQWDEAEWLRQLPPAPQTAEGGAAP